MTCIKVTAGKPILMLRLWDSLTIKLGSSMHHIPTVHTYQEIEKSFIGNFQLDKPIHSTSLEKIILDNFLNHKFCILSDEWRSFNKLSDYSDQYSELDWQLDSKTGYRFDSTARTDDCLNCVPFGVDIKNPWELSRMQQLPFIAKMCVQGDIDPQKACNEFQYVIDDFVEHNKMGYGVNWACTMDVAIRAINMLIAFDILGSFDKFDAQFKYRFSHSVLEHGAYIYRNLEKNFLQDKSGNHYLSNLCGLIVVGAYVGHKKGKRWIRFASQELYQEIQKQIFDDGGNYEFSTAYQRLDCEVLALSIAVLVAIGYDIPEFVINKLSSALGFLEATLYPDGQIIQIGDNDSGHLFRLSYKGKIENNEVIIDELDGNASVDVLRALFEKDGRSTEHMLIRSFMKNTVLKRNENMRTTSIRNDRIILTEGISYRKERTFDVFASGPVSTRIFSDFGLAVMKTIDFMLFFRVPTSLSYGKLLHVHSDFLHFEFYDGKNKYFRDRGSYTYTGSAKTRNLFRSSAFHNVPDYGVDQNLFEGFWGVKNQINGIWEEKSQTSICAQVTYSGIIHRRQILFDGKKVHVIDEGNREFENGYAEPELFSAGYGIIERELNQ